MVEAIKTPTDLVKSQVQSLIEQGFLIMSITPSHYRNTQDGLVLVEVLIIATRLQ
jgi:hypothetical protein